MKDLAEILHRMKVAAETADKTHESCTEHAQKMLSADDYVAYLILMNKLTDLMASMAEGGKLNILKECIASMNKIMLDGESISSGFNPPPK